MWQASPADDSDTVRLKLQYVSPAGEMGYPGTLTTTVTYTLGQENELRVDYHATTDAPTVINLTNHSYFNLAGEDTLDVYDQKVNHQRRQLHPNRSDTDPDRADRPGQGHTFRLHVTDRDRRAYQRE